MQISYYLLGFLVFWILALTLIVIWIFRFLRGLTKEVEKNNLVEVLKAILEKEKINTQSIKFIEKELKRHDEEGLLHIQKLAFVRFNPFREMGGDHSFALALLDGKDDGFVLTGLHTRERTRVYAKEIKRGKSPIELSSEESKALILAQKKKG